MGRIFSFFGNVYRKSWSSTLHQIGSHKMFMGNQVKNFYNKRNIQIFEAPVNDHRAIGLVEELIQTIMIRLASIKEEKSASNTFHVRHALKIFVKNHS